MATKWQRNGQPAYTGQSPGFNGASGSQWLGSQNVAAASTEIRVQTRSAWAAIASLIDDFVGAGYQRRWHGEPERFCGLEVDREFEFGRLQEWQIGRLRAL
jgi:hypothetical protein